MKMVGCVRRKVKYLGSPMRLRPMPQFSCCEVGLTGASRKDSRGGAGSMSIDRRHKVSDGVGFRLRPPYQGRRLGAAIGIPLIASVGVAGCRTRSHENANAVVEWSYAGAPQSLTVELLDKNDRPVAGELVIPYTNSDKHNGKKTDGNGKATWIFGLAHSGITRIERGNGTLLLGSASEDIGISVERGLMIRIRLKK